MKRPATSALIAACLFALPATGQARADVTIEGNLDRLTVVAVDADPADIIDTIGSRFDLVVENLMHRGGLVNGRFNGTLSEVLRSVLGDGFAIAYRNGLPVRITFVADSAGSTFIPRGEIDSHPKPRAEAALKPATDLLDEPGHEDAAGTHEQTGLSRAEATMQAVRELDAMVKALRDDMQQ